MFIIIVLFEVLLNYVKIFLFLCTNLGVMKKIRQNLLFIVAALILITVNCKKEPKCGCDGDVLSEITDGKGTVYFNIQNGYAYIIENQLNTKYDICSVSDLMDDFEKLEDGDKVIFSGFVKDDCYKRINPYAYYYFVIVLSKIAKDSEK